MGGPLHKKWGENYSTKALVIIVFYSCLFFPSFFGVGPPHYMVSKTEFDDDNSRSLLGPEHDMIHFKKDSPSATAETSKKVNNIPQPYIN